MDFPRDAHGGPLCIPDGKKKKKKSMFSMFAVCEAGLFCLRWPWETVSLQEVSLLAASGNYRGGVCVCVGVSFDPSQISGKWAWGLE